MYMKKLKSRVVIYMWFHNSRPLINNLYMAYLHAGGHLINLKFIKDVLRVILMWWNAQESKWDKIIH